uniref:Uncharacterized protein n=1 Tax=Anguilla anguilla TaxID=7936 RepID=A0A0E9UJZ5_ANGAN
MGRHEEARQAAHYIQCTLVSVLFPRCRSDKIGSAPWGKKSEQG